MVEKEASVAVSFAVRDFFYLSPDFAYERRKKKSQGELRIVRYFVSEELRILEVK